MIKNVNVNQQLIVDIGNAVTPGNVNESKPYQSLFKDVTNTVQVNYLHQEADFVDFDIQRLMPHKLSQYGPALAVADVDGNGTDDLYIGGSGRSSGLFLLQGRDGKFKQKPMKAIDNTYDDLTENRGVLFFDASGRGHQDLYVTAGSNESPAGSANYQDRLYLNDGKGNFTLAKSALPVNTTSKSCVKAADYDRNGTFDIFIGGRLIPGEYPKPASCVILRNDSKNNTCKFTDVTKEIAPFLNDIGMVSDALWTDFDEDGWQDLVLVGEFMPVTFIKNNHGQFINVTAKMGLQNEQGCWNSIVSGDFTNSGHLDYVVGNMGNNTFYKASKKQPVRVYAKDFDQNGSYDAIPSVYLKDEDGNYQEYPAFTRDDMIKQMIGFRRKYPTYKGFGKATMKEIFSDEDLEGALIVKANNMSTSLVRHNGKSGFTMTALPIQAQYAPVFAMVTDDFDNDGNLDIAITGNDFSIEVGSGRCDALNGLILRGNGKGGFLPVSIKNSGLFIPGDGKALVKLKGTGNNYLVAASQNRGPLKIFASSNNARTIAVKRDDVYAMINYKNGQHRKVELYYGDSFESQSSRFIKIDNKIRTITIVDKKGIKRTAYTNSPS